MRSIVRWDPFQETVDLQRRINKLFDDVFASDHMSERHLSLPVDVHETADELIVRADIPGVKMEDISVEVQGDYLTIRGERKISDEYKVGNMLRQEVRTGTFTRSFNLGVPVDADRIEATYDRGVLTVRLPKAEEVKPKMIPVKEVHSK